MQATDSQPSVSDLFDGPESDHYFRDLLPTLINESDRGAVLLGASQLDNQLTDFFDALVPATTSGKRRKEIFNITGPFGSFSGKLDVAFTCRLLPETLVTAIHRFRKLRNDVAHKPISFSLTDHTDEVRAIFALIGTGVELGVTSMASQLMVQNAVASVVNLDDPTKPGEKLFADQAAALDYLLKNKHHFEKLEPHRLRWEVGVGLGLICALIAYHKRNLLQAVGPNKSFAEAITQRIVNVSDSNA